MTWTNAALACASYAVGGHLVFIDSAVEQTAITTLINNYGSCEFTITVTEMFYLFDI